MMKDLYRLINVEFQAMFKATLIICLCALLIPIFLIRSELKHYHVHAVHERFEDVVASAGSNVIFVILMVVICLWFLVRFYSQYWGSKSIYTMVTLPVRRGTLYFSKIIAFIISLLMLIACYVLSVLWSYQLMAAKVGSFDDPQLVMNNGLFLAFIRSDFLRVLFPLTLEGVVSILSLLILIVTGLYYGALCERSRRYGGYVVIVAACVLVFRWLKMRAAQPLNPFYESVPNLYMYSLMMVVMSIFFIWHSIRLIKKGAIT